jgi:hypothetical protein
LRCINSKKIGGKYLLETLGLIDFSAGDGHRRGVF